MTETIVAVAIGETYRQAVPPITSLGTVPSWARRYINGFINAFPHTIGLDYIIDYRECPAAVLSQNVFTNGLIGKYIICLSTTVMGQAAQIYPPAPPPNNKFLIGVVSRPQNQPFFHQGNACGVSAERSDDALQVYQNLLNSVSPALAGATVLHDPNYIPSIDSHNAIAHLHPNFVQVTDLPGVQAAIGGMVARCGLLVFPVDWMFGGAQKIIGWANTASVLDFWFATDWVVQSPALSAFGGYGVSQETSGDYLAQQVDAIWTTNNLPNNVWKHVRPAPADRDWKVSTVRAQSAGVQPNPNNPPVGPGKVN